MKIAFGFSVHFFGEEDQALPKSIVESAPIVIVDWNYPVLPSQGQLIDIELLSSFSEVPKELVKSLEYSVDYVCWALYDQQIMPIIQLYAK